MTLQLPERLSYEGRSVNLLDAPLESHLDSMSWAPHFALRSTGLWRGYEGSSAVDDHGTLCLNGIRYEHEVILDAEAGQAVASRLRRNAHGQD